MQLIKISLSTYGQYGFLLMSKYLEKEQTQTKIK